MATSQYTFNPFHTIGPATVLISDPAVDDGWRSLGRVAEAQLNVTTEQAAQDIFTGGVSQPVARRNTAKRYSISFRLLENANPDALALFGGEGAAATTAGLELCAATEVLRLYGSDWRELAHPYGLAAEPLPAATAISGSASGSGGSIPAGTYTYWIVPVCEAGDVVFHGTLSGPLTVTVGTGEVVKLAYTPPADWTPDSYAVWVAASGLSSEATLAMDGLSGAELTISEHAGTAVTSPAGAVLTATPYGGGAAYTSGVDFELNVTRGLLRRIDGGALREGDRVTVTYAYWRPASVSIPLGDPVAPERYRRVRLLQLAPDAEDPALWRETGVEFTFYRVNINLGDTGFPFSEREFSPGLSFHWDCLWDAEAARVGDVRSTHGVLANYA